MGAFIILLFVIHHSSFIIRHSSFIIWSSRENRDALGWVHSTCFYSSFIIRHSSFVISH